MQTPSRKKQCNPRPQRLCSHSFPLKAIRRSLKSGQNRHWNETTATPYLTLQCLLNIRRWSTNGSFALPLCIAGSYSRFGTYLATWQFTCKFNITKHWKKILKKIKETNTIKQHLFRTKQNGTEQSGTQHNTKQNTTNWNIWGKKMKMK